MPVHPDHAAYYRSKQWREQRQRILARAENECECRGECSGNPREHADDREGRCHAPNGVRIQRYRSEPSTFAVGIGWPSLDFFAPVRVVLTVAHLDHDSGQAVPDDRLLALCQFCHLRLDRAQHRDSAKRTRQAKRDKANPYLPFVTES